MLVELAYPLSPDMPVFPGLPTDDFLPHTRMRDGGESNTTMVHLFTHNGTHVDAPFHFYIKGQTIDQVAIENFVFTRPLVVQKTLGKGGLIQRADLEAYGQDLCNADLLFLCTGYHAIRHDRDIYMDDFPALSVDAAKMIRTELLNVKAIAIDTLSIESCKLGPQLDFPVHKTLLDGDRYPHRPVLIFEDVNMAPALAQPLARVYAFPLRFAGLDGSPVTIVGETH